MRGIAAVAQNPPRDGDEQGQQRRRQRQFVRLPGRELEADCPAGSADSDEGGHLFQSDRGHHSNLMAASLMAARLASSRRPVLVMS